MLSMVFFHDFFTSVNSFSTSSDMLSFSGSTRNRLSTTQGRGKDCIHYACPDLICGVALGMLLLYILSSFDQINYTTYCCRNLKVHNIEDFYFQVELAENITSCINFLQTGRISLLSVAENIITCLSWGVILKIACTSLLMSATEYM